MYQNDSEVIELDIVEIDPDAPPTDDSDDPTDPSDLLKELYDQSGCDADEE